MRCSALSVFSPLGHDRVSESDRSAMSPRERRAYFLPLEERVLASEQLWPPDAPREARVRGLAAALAASPCWSELPDALMLVRPHDPPAIVIAGRFEPSEAARVELLRAQLELIVARTRYRDYGDVEGDCAALADRLLDRLGPSARSDYRMVGIPRGGRIVSGMLSYLLDLPPDRCSDSVGSGDPLLVVDDCAISGTRFRSFLAHVRSDEVVFAHLWSCPPLRAAIEEEEPSVSACVAGRDLEEVGLELSAGEYEAWKERWSQRDVAIDRGYWRGLTEHVCFPWNEPDVQVWNPVAEREEAGWRVVPPERCLENRVATDATRVLLQPPARGPLRPADDVVFGDAGDAILVARPGEATCWSLEGTAAASWRAMVTRGTAEGIVAELAAGYEADADVIAADVDSFVDELRAHQLITSEPSKADGVGTP